MPYSLCSPQIDGWNSTSLLNACIFPSNSHIRALQPKHPSQHLSPQKGDPKRLSSSHLSPISWMPWWKNLSPYSIEGQSSTIFTGFQPLLSKPVASSLSQVCWGVAGALFARCCILFTTFRTSSRISSYKEGCWLCNNSKHADICPSFVSHTFLLDVLSEHLFLDRVRLRVAQARNKWLVFAISSLMSILPSRGPSFTFQPGPAWWLFQAPLFRELVVTTNLEKVRAKMSILWSWEPEIQSRGLNARLCVGVPDRCHANSARWEKWGLGDFEVASPGASESSVDMSLNLI